MTAITRLFGWEGGVNLRSVILITAGRGRSPDDNEVETLPTLELYVTRGCSSCRRAERALRECAGIARLVTLKVRELGAPGTEAPPSVFGGPTVVFRDRVVALGTPDCGELSQRLELLMRAVR